MFLVMGLLLMIGILWFIVKFLDSKNETLKGLAYLLGFFLLAAMFFAGGPTNF